MEKDVAKTDTRKLALVPSSKRLARSWSALGIGQQPSIVLSVRLDNSGKLIIREHIHKSLAHPAHLTLKRQSRKIKKIDMKGFESRMGLVCLGSFFCFFVLMLIGMSLAILIDAEWISEEFVASWPISLISMSLAIAWGVGVLVLWINALIRFISTWSQRTELANYALCFLLLFGNIFSAYIFYFCNFPGEDRERRKGSERRKRSTL